MFFKDHHLLTHAKFALVLEWNIDIIFGTIERHLAAYVKELITTALNIIKGYDTRNEHEWLTV